jgi:hypothetical protein
MTNYAKGADRSQKLIHDRGLRGGSYGVAGLVTHTQLPSLFVMKDVAVLWRKRKKHRIATVRAPHHIAARVMCHEYHARNVCRGGGRYPGVRFGSSMVCLEI